MFDLDLTSPGHSRSKQMSPNERPSYPSLIKHLAVSARVSKLRPSEIYLTSISSLRATLGQRQWCQMNLIYDFLSIINSNSVVILNRFGDTGHWKLCDMDWPFTVTQGQRQLRQMKPHIYDFLSIINSNSVVILNRFGDIGHWKPVWPGLTFQGRSRSKKTMTNETLYMTSYMWIMVTIPLSCTPFEI